MKRLAVALVLLLVTVAALVAASGYLLRSLLSGAGGQRVVALMEHRAGVPLRVESIEFDVDAWYRLTPALSLRGVRVGNPPGFRSESLLTAGHVRAQVALRPLLSRRIEVQSLTLAEPVLTMEKNRQGISNFEAFVAGLGGEAGAADAGAQSATTLAIASIRMTKGELRLAEAGFRDIDLVLDGFAPGQPCQVKLTAADASHASRFRFDGTLGPFAKESLPLDGEFGADAALAALPADLRRLRFGELLVEPGDKARVDLSARLKGNLFGALQGPARVNFREVYVGREHDHRLRMEGEAPMQVSVSKIMSTPVTNLKMRNAALRLGPGEWKGNVDVLSVGGVLRGKSTGSIRNIEISEFLAAFTRASGKIEGLLEIPEYSLRFGGRDAAGIRRSLSGEGKISLGKGKLKALDLLASIRNAIERPKADPTATSGDTEFTTLTADSVIRDERLTLDNLSLGGPALQASGNGSVTFEQALGFRLNTLVRGRIAEWLGKTSTAERAAETAIPMTITGTLDNPKVLPDVKRLAIDTGISYAEKILKGKPGEKLLDLIPFGRKKTEPQPPQ